MREHAIFSQTGFDEMCVGSPAWKKAIIDSGVSVPK